MAVFVLGATSVAAEIVPTLSTKTLTDSANVDETIKGEPIPRRLLLNFSMPAADGWGNVAGGGLQPGTYRVIFLYKNSSGYKFASPYYPSIPASPTSCDPSWQDKLSEDAYGKVLGRVLDFLCTDSTPGERRSVFLVLNWEDSSAAQFLKAALSLPSVKSEQNLRIAIVSDLLHWNDLSVLPMAEDDLFNQSVQSVFFRNRIWCWRCPASSRKSQYHCLLGC